MSAPAVAAWYRWQTAAGPWQNWSVCPALLSPEPLPPRCPLDRRPADVLARTLEPLLVRGRVLCVLDLPPVLGVGAAASLAHLAHPMLVLARWPYAEAVLPTAELIWTLVTRARDLPAASARLTSAVVVRDGERALSLPDRRADDPRADNRHRDAIIDLPNLATLRARGIERVEHISMSR